MLCCCVSLKSFHIVFIAVSTLVVFFFGVWAAFRGIVDSRAMMVAAGLAAFGAGAGLICYGVGFIRKLKSVGIY